ncbi:hypothetical protein [Verrucomicrobium sp. BvORR034]|uniref:hypothetical protein n=1 Tax=Verrucomicrobium sp. BvORR034 TaxID=1396418 RepID=UPI000679B240|nr:hypothetical protein [Verrucomicrobium sp. BvORR034]
MATRIYDVTPATFYQYNRHRQMWEAFSLDEDGLRDPINEYCETDSDAIRSCLDWQQRRDSDPIEPPF